MSDEVISRYAKRLERYRNESGKTIAEMASLVGVTFESYRDLEFRDDELLQCISLAELGILSKALNIKAVDLFAEGSASHQGITSLTQLAEAIQEYLSKRGKTLPEFETIVGWEIGNALNEPKEFLVLNVTALKDICRELGLDWLSVLASIAEQSTQQDDKLEPSK
jgi:transcriptional regulator with XRE-family HTH domain